MSQGNSDYFNNTQPPEMFYDMFYYNLFPMTNDDYNIIMSLIKNFRNSNFKLIDMENISHYEISEDILHETFKDIRDIKIYDKLHNNELVYIDLKSIMYEFDKNINYYNDKMNEVVHVINHITSDTDIYDKNKVNTVNNMIEFNTAILNYYQLFPVLLTILKDKLHKQVQINASSDTIVNKMTNTTLIDVIDNSNNTDTSENYNKDMQIREASKQLHSTINISQDLQKETIEIEDLIKKIKDKELIQTNLNTMMTKTKKMAWIYEGYSIYEDMTSRMNDSNPKLSNNLINYTVNGNLLDINVNKTNLYMILSRYFALISQIFYEKELQKYTINKIKNFISLFKDPLLISTITNIN